MTLSDTLGTLLGVAAVGVVAWIAFEYLGGKQALAGLAGGTTSGVPGGSWICQTFSIGCPVSSSTDQYDQFQAANPTTPTQAAWGAEFTSQVLAAFQAGNYNSLGSIAPGWGITIVPAGVF